MRNGIMKGAIPLFTVGMLWAGTARAQDRCDLFANGDFTGTSLTMLLPAVTTTLSSGAPLNSFWANTSRRYTSGDLGSLNNSISSARVYALDSDVAIYLLDGADLSGKGRAFHCKRGFTCTLQLGSEMDNATSSVICQREFFRKAMFADPNVDQVLAYFTALLNPIVDMAQVSSAVDAVAQSEFANDSDIDAYRPTNSEDGYDLWSRTTWLTAWDYCRRNGYSCGSDTSQKYKDMFRISKRFEIDVDDTWADIVPFMDDDYVIEADWYIRPVISDHDGDASTPNQLLFWWGLTTVWVEGGSLHDAIADKAVPKIFDVDIQSALRGLVVYLAQSAGCPQCIDGKNRLQFSIYTTSNALKNFWVESFTMDVTQPKMILNDSRDATYND
jgi:hypothetical protein